MKSKPYSSYFIRWIVCLIMCTAYLSVHAEVSDEKLLHYEKSISSFPKPVQASIMHGLINYYVNVDIDKAVMYAHKILTEYNETSNVYKPYHLAAYHILGLFELRNKNYTEALTYYFSALDIIDEGYKEDLRKYIYADMAFIYIDNGDYELAMKYSIKSLELLESDGSQQSNEVTLHSKVLNFLFETYYTEEKYDSALYYSAQLEKIGLNDNPDQLTKAYLNFSFIYAQKKQYETAIFYAQKGLNQSIIQIEDRLNLYIQLASCYLSIGEVGEAKDAIHEGTYFLVNCTDFKTRSLFYLTGSKVYEAADNLNQSYNYLEHYIASRDTIDKTNQTLIKQNIQRQYQVHQKNVTIQSLQENNILKDADLKKNKTILYSITILAALLLITFSVIILMQRDKFRNRRIIAAQRAELTKKQYLEELHDAELKAAQAHIQGQEKERERLSKELHDGVGGTLAGIKMELESYISSKPEDKRLLEISDLILSTYKEVRAISHNFAIPDVMRGNFTDNLRNLIHNIPGKNGLHIQLSVYQNIMWDNIGNNIKIELYRIIQESITNIIKHAEAKSAEIQIFEDDDYLNITIEDDGKGFNQAAMKRGIGIKNIKSRIEVLKGKFDIDTSPGNGTFLFFNIPIIG